MLTREQHTAIQAEALKRAEARLNGLTPRELRQYALKGLLLTERFRVYKEFLAKEPEEVHGG